MTSVPWHDLNAVPVRPSRVLSAWRGPEAQRTNVAAVQRDRERQARSYAGAGIDRLTGDWTALNTSADSELLTSLRVMRARSRQLVRDNPHAKHAARLIVNNVIGNGIGMQAQVASAAGKLQQRINDNIEQAHADWAGAKTCHTAGVLSLSDIERLAAWQLVTAGEAILRIVREPFGGSGIPLALEVIEADRLLDQWQTAHAPNGNIIRLGVEMDSWHRPIAYWFNPRHPGDYQFTTFDPAKFLRVPAEDIIHLYVVERWPQTRGEPWFHSTLRALHDRAGYEEAEIVKARAAANIVGFIRSPEPVAPDAVENGRRLIDTEPGTWQTLLPGEDVAGFTQAPPSSAIDPFLKYMLRREAVGIGISYEAYSRDYVGATYSSMRVGLLDDRDLYRVLQGFFIRNLRTRVHQEFLDAAILMGRIKGANDYAGNRAKYQAVRFKPRGWSWIDPAKEVAAYKMAVRNGFMLQGDVIAQTANGADVEDVLRGRRQELDMAADLELIFDSDPLQVNDKGQTQPVPPATEVEGGEASEGAEVDAATDADTAAEAAEAAGT